MRFWVLRLERAFGLGYFFLRALALGCFAIRKPTPQTLDSKPQVLNCLVTLWRRERSDTLKTKLFPGSVFRDRVLQC